MFYQILQLFYPLLIVTLPVWISRWSLRFHRGMTGFRLLVANSDQRLRQIRRIAWAILFSFLTCRVLMNDKSIGATVCLLFTLLLCKEDIVHKVIVWFTSYTHFFIAAIAAIVCAAFPQLYSVAMTLAILMLASWCYPSQKMIDRVREPDVQSGLLLQLHSDDIEHLMLPKSRILYDLYIRKHAWK